MSDPHVPRLRALQDELQQILEDRLKELVQAVTDGEEAARRILTAEVELERHRALASRLQAEADALAAELGAVGEQTVRLAALHRQAQAELEAHRGRQSLGEAEVAEIRRAVEAGRAQLEALEAEARALREENTTLKNKLDTLQENVQRMRRLRQELMTSISGLTQEMTGLAGGNNE